MKQTQLGPTLKDYGGILRRRWFYIATIAPAILLAAIYAAYALQPLYESSATILLEPSSVPKEVISTTVVSYSDQQIELVQGRVMTIDILKELVHEVDPYPGSGLSTNDKARQILEDTTLERVDPVTGKPLVESNAFVLRYRNMDPDIASEVATRLAKLFLTYNTRSRTEAAQQAALFLQKQSESISKQMREIDDEIGALKVKHGDALPELQMRNQASIDRLQHDSDNLQQQILSTEEKESLLAVQLSQTSPNLMTQSGDLTDLATVKAQLAEAEQRYTPEHPEVKRLRRAMETLLAQKNGTGDANNPQYLMIKSQLDAARRELSSLRFQAGKVTEQMNQYEQFLRNTPGVEREYSEILRRKQYLQTEYEQIHDKLQNAQLATTFESEERGERFTLLRAPYPASSPVYPNRIGLILLGLVLGCAIAAVAVAIAESADPNIRNAEDLPASANSLLLASIPVITNSQDRRKHKMFVASMALAYGTAIVVVAGTVFKALSE